MKKKGKKKEKRKKRKKKKKRMAFLVATTSLPAVYRPNDDRWNAACSCQNLMENNSKRSELHRVGEYLKFRGNLIFQ